MSVIADIHSHTGGVWDEYLDLLTNGAHWMFEVTSDIVVGIILYKPIGYFWNRWHDRHDREHHNDAFFGK